MAATQQDQRVMESHLRELKSLGRLRRFLADLNYPVADEPVSTANWRPELAKLARDGSLRVVARHDDFVVTHCLLPQMRPAAERETVTRLVRQYNRGLFVFSDQTGIHWHFINVKRDSKRHNRLVLRRIAVGPEEQLRTAVERIALLKVVDASWTGLEVELHHEEAFDVEKVTEQFYRDYKEICDHISGRLQQQVNLRTARAFAQQFMNRMMFLYFLQKKGWLDGRADFVPWLWDRYQRDTAGQGSFYARFLDPLFFQALNSPSDDLTPSVPKQQLYARRDLPDDIKQVFLRLPYLNGGLFSRIEGIDDQGLAIEDSEFENLFENLLEHYNFTVSEDTPLDVEVAVNPEMLGKVYEKLVLEEERGQAGIFYTPRVELDFMCRRSLIEYLDEEPIIDRPDLIRLVMNADTPEFVPDFPPERLRQIRRKLEEVTVVDPACGSGAFLVGMMQVLSGLQRLICARLGEPYKDFEVKKRIIGENLFGVDIKDWAVRVAELRLWLSLIIHASVDEVREDPGKPILPNLTFRIRRGDSLVQEVGGVNLSLRKGSADISPSLKGRITRLKAEKLRFYNNELDRRFRTEEELKHEELAIFRAILDERIHNLQNKRAGLASRLEEARIQQGQLPGLARERGRQQSFQEVEFDKQIEALAEELERAQQARQALRTLQDIPFVWDIAFVEVFKGERANFDVVIGNPPYVRQEEIAPLNKDPEKSTPDQWREEKRKYKEALQRSVQTHWGTQVKVGGRADYYVYFYLHGLALLRERGTFCFITSNSWLDVGYGADLQQFLLTNIEVKAIYDNHAKRSFASSDINTIIVLFRRPPAGADLLSHKARFVAFKRPFEAVLTADNLTLIEWADSVQRTDDFRVYPLAQADLWQAGLASEDDTSKAMALGFGHGKYGGDKWGGKYLRAPDIFFTILEKGKGKLVRLGDIAEVTTVSWSRQGQNAELMNPKFGGKPSSRVVDVLKSPRDVARITLDRTDTQHFLKLERWVEEQLTYAPIVWVDLRGDKHICHRCLEPIAFTHNFHGISPRNEHFIDLLCAVTNSSLCWLFIEVIGRRGLGGGAVRVLVNDLKSQFPTFNPSSLTPAQQSSLRAVFEHIATREIMSVFEELGLPKPNRDYSNIRPEDVSLDRVLPDRRALDKVVFEALGLTEQEQLEVYRAVVGLVKDRLSKARSL